MTMPYSPSRAVYEGNNAATCFPFFFRVWDASQLVVTLTSPKGVTSEAAGWTADLEAAGGSVTYLHENAPLPDGWKLAITRNMPFTQEVNLVSASRFDPQVIEDALDQAAAERQQTLEMMRRAVILPATSSETPQDVVLAIYAARDAAQTARNTAEAARAAAGQSAVEAAKSAVAAAHAVETATAEAVTAATTQAGRAQDAAYAAEAAAEAAADDARLAIAGEISRASGEANRASTEADRAKNEADRAQSLANIGPATSQQLGMVKIGEGIAITEDGAISVTPVNLATTERPGTVRPGSGMTIDTGGALHIAYWDAFPPCVPIPVWGVTFGGSDGRRAIMPGETAAREDWILCDGGNDGKGGTMPNLAGRTLLGADASHVAGTIGGSGSHSHTVVGSVGDSTLSVAQLASHSHSYTSMFGLYNKQPGESITWQQTGATTGATGSNASHTHTLSATTAAESSFMPFCALHFIMRVI